MNERFSRTRTPCDACNPLQILGEVPRGVGQHGKSPGEVAIARTLRLPSVTAAIVGARKPGQLSQLIGPAAWQLSPAEASEIEQFLAENPA